MIRHNKAIDYTKFALLIFIFLAATESFSRTGSSTLFWFAIYATVSFFIAADLDSTLDTLRRNWIVVLTPIIALISVFWSPVPAWTFRASIQLLFSVIIGVWIGMTFQASTIYKALVIATGIGIIASLLNYHFGFIPAFDREDYIGAEQYFVGIYTQKNVLGKVFDLFGISLLIIAIRSGKVWLGLPILLALTIPLLEVKSASSLVAYFIILTLPILWWIKKNVVSIALLFVVSIFISLLIIFIATTGSVDVLENALTMLGKDTTFTGRTLLWEAGGKIIAENPILGVGFQAYWQPGQFMDTKGFLITIVEGLNGFHNVYIEVLVGTGLIGLIAYLGLHITVITQTIRWASHNSSAEGLGTIYLVLITILLSFFDVIAYRQHEIFFILLIVVITMTSRPLQTDLKS